MIFEHFCEFPDRLIGVLTKPEFRLTVPIPFTDEVQAWCAENLRGGVNLQCIGTQIHDDADGLALDYYISFEDEVDLLIFKMKWFDAQGE